MLSTGGSMARATAIAPSMLQAQLAGRSSASVVASSTRQPWKSEASARLHASGGRGESSVMVWTPLQRVETGKVPGPRCPRCPALWVGPLGAFFAACMRGKRCRARVSRSGPSHYAWGQVGRLLLHRKIHASGSSVSSPGIAQTHRCFPPSPGLPNLIGLMPSFSRARRRTFGE